MSSNRFESSRLPLIGLVFLLAVLGLMGASIADYSGAFRSRTRVTLTVPDAGNQLSLGAQVKLRGAVVGTVDRIESSRQGARLELGLDPDYTKLIPTNTVARILPKTLVGQDYVDLVLPQSPARTTVTEGDVLQRDVSAPTAKLEGALDHLLEVLQYIPPQQVAATLNSVATALEGRGDKLGTTLTSFQKYVSGLNPSLPALTADLRALSEFSRTYQQAAPDLLAAVRDLGATADTIAEQRAQFHTLLDSVGIFADRTRVFLAANENSLISLADVSRSTLATLATYAPEYPCLLNQLAGLVPRVDQAFGKGDKRPALNVSIVVTNSRGKYRPKQDEPRYLDTRGPRCYQIVKKAPQYPGDGPLKDGSTSPTAASRTALAGSREEAALIAGLLGRDGERAPFASLLLGPILRGSEVTVR